jgi:hypothetical protein
MENHAVENFTRLPFAKRQIREKVFDDIPVLIRERECTSLRR